MTARTATVTNPSPPRPRDEADVANAAMLAFATDLAGQGERVELQGTVVNDHGAQTVVAHCIVGAILGLASLRWPLWSLLGLVLVARSVMVDLDGGRGWVRRLAPRTVSRNLLLWRGPTTRERIDAPVRLPSPAGPKAKDRVHGPQPVVPPPRGARRAVLVVCLPLEAVRTRSSSHLLGVPIALLGVSIASIVSRPLLHEIATGATFWTAAALGLCAAIAAVARRASPVRTDPATGRAMLDLFLAALDRTPPQRSDLVIALVGGGTLHNDGVEILLRNHINRLPPNRTRVLAWHPASGPLRVVAHEGRVLKRTPDPWLARRAEGLVVPEGWQTTAAMRAMGSGWQAMALAGGRDQPETVVDALHQLVLAQDLAAPADTIP